MTIKPVFLLFALLFSTGSLTALAQEPAAPPLDPIQQLNLTPEQRQRIRILAEQTREERQLTNRRVREANIALDQAVDAQPIDDNLVEQRVNELAAAQAAQIRMRIHMELRIRRLLDPEQLATLRRLRLQVRDVMGAPKQNNLRRPNNALRPRP